MQQRLIANINPDLDNFLNTENIVSSVGQTFQFH